MLQVERQDAVQVRDDDVCLLRQGHARREVLDELDPFGIAVGRGDLAGRLNRAVRFDGVDAARAEAAGQQRENARAGPDIQHDATGAHGLFERPHIRIRPICICDHLAVTGDAIS